MFAHPLHSPVSVPTSASPLHSSSATSVSLSSYLTPSKYKLPLFHHIHATHAPIFCSASIDSYSIGRVTMYWEMLFWRLMAYVFTSSVPAAATADSKGRYSHHPSISHFSFIPTKRWYTLYCNHPMVHLIRGGRHPGLLSEQEGFLNYRLVNFSRGPGV